MTNAKQHGEESAEDARKKALCLYSERIEKCFDTICGRSYLKKNKIAKLGADSLTHFDNVRYHLHAWFVMPNHVHVIAAMLKGYNLSKILHSWKSCRSAQGE